MKLFLDTEFTGLHQNATLMSLALVAEDGRAFYAEFTDYDASQCDDWVRQHVLAHTRWLHEPGSTPGQWQENALSLCLGDQAQVRMAVEAWLGQFDQLEIWADCPAWDWVLFCELFGGALGLPQNIYYLPFDLVTLFKARQLDPDTNREAFVGWPAPDDAGGEKARHNALYDARLGMACLVKLMEMPR